MASKKLKGEIRVAARVIDFLSSGLYENAAACLKELINNSYDADASVVNVIVKPDADVISVEDDGVGMTAEQFEDHFQRVAESHKRDAGERTPGGREKIGKIGIGFIAANELCDEMELYSTQKGSTDLLHVTIEFGAIRERSFVDRRRKDSEVVKGDYHGEVLEADRDESFTRVYLKKLRTQAREQFLRPATILGDDNVKSIYGLKPESVRELISSLDGLDELDLYSQTRLKVGLNVPVKYLPDWAPEAYVSQLSDITQETADLDFSVIYDGTELYKPTLLLDPRGNSVFRRISYAGEYISVDGYLFARHGAYKPRQLNGVLIRVRQAAVGDYDENFLGYPKHLFPLFQDWTSGEIRVSGQLDDALNIDRRTFRETHPAYRELQDWFLAEFAEFLALVRSDLYTKPSKARSQAKAEGARTALSAVRERAGDAFGPAAARSIERAFPAPAATSVGPPRARDSRALLRTYSLAEIYEAAIAAAEAVGLSDDEAERFLDELGRRLHG